MESERGPAEVVQQDPMCSDDTQCDSRSTRVAKVVRNQLPQLPAVPSEVSLWYELTQRAVHTPSADHRIFYGTHYTEFGDLRLPEGFGPFPTATLIHGGAWQSRVTLDYMAPLADALRGAGIATWTIEYRRLGADAVWPAMFHDVGAAADFLRQLAPYYPLDVNRVTAVGHSSGGHLALWLAARACLPADAELYNPDPLPLTGAVSLAGIADLNRYMDVLPMAQEYLLTLLGGNSKEAVAPQMREASPVELLPLGKPQVLIHGEFDPYAPLLLAEEYVQKAVAAGDRVKLITLQGGGHFTPADPADRLAWPAIRNAVLSTLDPAHTP